GRSFWILDDITPLRQLSESTAREEAHLFTPAAAWRVRRSTYPDTPIPPDEPMAENPPRGVLIDYFLGNPASTVTIEILDSQQKLVRRYSSSDQPEQTEEQLQKQLIPLYWLQPHKAPLSTAGMHRWVWDLRYATPNSTQHEYPISAVPHKTPRNPRGPR